MPFPKYLRCHGSATTGSEPMGSRQFRCLSRRPAGLRTAKRVHFVNRKSSLMTPQNRPTPLSLFAPFRPSCSSRCVPPVSKKGTLLSKFHREGNTMHGQHLRRSHTPPKAPCTQFGSEFVSPQSCSPMRPAGRFVPSRGAYAPGRRPGLCRNQALASAPNTPSHMEPQVERLPIRAAAPPVSCFSKTEKRTTRMALDRHWLVDADSASVIAGLWPSMRRRRPLVLNGSLRLKRTLILTFKTRACAARPHS